jgi:acyl dehydratase
MYFEDIALHQKVTLGSYAFTEENILAFARAYDPQPFHIDRAAAAQSPYGGLIASGWHTASVWMRLTLEWRRAQVALGAPEVQANFVSPGVRDLRWLKPVRPGMVLTYTNEATAKLDWPSRPTLGLLEGMNEAHDQAGVLVYSFVNRVLIARRPRAER